jgi:hypothetical protein
LQAGKGLGTCGGVVGEDKEGEERKEEMSTIRIVGSYRDSGERISYERFVHNQPHIVTNGLWREGGQFYIHCPEMTSDSLALSGRPLIEEFNTGERIICARVTLANYIPINAVRIPDRTPVEVAVGAGSAITRADIEYDLALELRGILSDFQIKCFTSIIQVIVPLEPEQNIIDEVKKIVTCLQLSVPLEIVVSTESDTPDNTKESPLGIFNRLNILSFSRRHLSDSVRKRWEEDEDLWLSHRRKLFSDKTATRNDFISASFFKKDGGRGFINATVAQDKVSLRSYLSLFGTTHIAAPLEKEYDSFLKNANITESELIKLVEVGRVKLIFPQSLDLYSSSLTSGVIEIGADTNVTSRQLASISVLELRKRHPFVFPFLDLADKKLILSSLHQQMINADKSPTKDFIAYLLENSSLLWGMVPDVLKGNGALGVNILGLSRASSKALNFNDDQTLIMDVAAQSVEWSAALDSIVIPYPLGGLDMTDYMQSIANVYSGVPDKDWVPTNFRYSDVLASKLLVVGEDIPITDFATAFVGAEVDRFRSAVFGLTEHKRSEEELNDCIKLFNKYVRSYDQSASSIWDIQGFIIDVVTLPTSIPLVSWGVNLIYKALQHYGKDVAHVQSVMDNLEAARHDTIPNAVLVSRMRKTLLTKYQEHKLK